MPKLQYQKIDFQKPTLKIIDQANEIITEYTEAGYTLTLRQLYYRFVAKNLLPNRDSSYDRLGSIINRARLAGLIDWLAIEDRTRFLRRLDSWERPRDIIDDVAGWYHRDWWRNQYYYVEVWIEKDALVGVIQSVCQEYDVPYFSCRGYASQSEIWRAGRRIKNVLNHDHSEAVILHLGDHDPSGIDMTADIENRLRMFTRSSLVHIERIALNMPQIREYDPPPNPTKLTDKRSPKYIDEFGEYCWELDALEPTTIVQLIEENIVTYLDEPLFEEQKEQEERERQQIQSIGISWDKVQKFLNT